MPTLNKLEYLDETKEQIKDALNTNFNSGITDEDTFRSYVGKIDDIYTNWAKVTDEGTEITLSNVKKGRMPLQPKGNTEQTTYSGKNLLAYTSYGELQQGILTTYDSNDGALILNGTASNTFSNITKESSLNISTGTYTFSISEAKDYNVRLRITYTDDTILNGTISKGDTSVNINITKAVKNQRIFIYEDNTLSGTIFTNERLYAQLEEGSTSTNFEKYVGGYPSPSPDYPQPVKVVTGNNTINVSDGTNSENYYLNLGSIDLCKIGEYQDYIYKDNGNWYKKSYIGKIVLNGSESWGYGGSSTPNVFYTTVITDYATSNNIPYSNYYIGNTNVNGASGMSSLANNTIAFINVSGGTTPRFYIKDTNYTLSADLKTWLGTHNLIVYYALITPTDTQITDETLITQLESLNNAMSFDGTNYISSEYATGNAPVIISASALMKGGN